MKDTLNYGSKIHRLIDVHMHLLPSYDDGPYDMEMCIEMMKCAYSQGIEGIFCTSHSFEDIPNALRYFPAFNATLEAAKGYLPELRVFKGTEIYGRRDNVDTILKWLSEGILCSYNDTKYLLLEYDTLECREDILYVARRITEAGYIPVIAHAERYDAMEELSLAEELMGMGCLLQVNVFSLYEEKNAVYRDRARYFLQNRKITFLGSDSHRMDHRPPDVVSGLQYVYCTVDTDYADAICFGNALALLM